jgi:hypothetical protein
MEFILNQKMFNISSFIVAACALGLSVWQGYVQREHNHVSLEPRINAYFQSNNGKSTTGLYLINNGLGPGYVERLDIYFDGKLISSKNQMDQWRFNSALLPLGLAQQPCIAVAGPRPNDSMKAGEEIQLITVSKGDLVECEKAKSALLGAAWSRLDFVLQLKSIYGDSYTYRFSKNEQK